MPGLKRLEEQRQDACDAAQEAIHKLRTARDPERARRLGHEVAQACGDATNIIRIIDKEQGWADLDREQLREQGC